MKGLWSLLHQGSLVFAGLVRLGMQGSSCCDVRDHGFAFGLQARELRFGV